MFSDHFKAPTRMLLWQCLPGGTNSGGTFWICPLSLHPGALSPYKGGRVKGKHSPMLVTAVPEVPSPSVFLPFRRQPTLALLEDLESHSRKAGYHLSYVPIHG